MDLIEKNRAFKEQMSEELDQKSEYARNVVTNYDKDLMLEKEKVEALQMQNSRLKEEQDRKSTRLNSSH